MSNPFFDHPILNSPYEYPTRHWELDDQGQPTQQIIESRRRAEFITPIPKPKKRKGSADQQQIVFDEGKGLSTEKQQYDPTSDHQEVRQHVDQWRTLPTPALAGHTGNGPPAPALAASQVQRHSPVLLPGRGGRNRHLADRGRPQFGDRAKAFLDHLAAREQGRQSRTDASRAEAGHRRGQDHGHGHADRLADDQCRPPPGSKHFTRGFLVVAPGLTIKDRLRVLQPNDPDSYYASRELVPQDMLDDVNRAKIVITNYHAFKLRERIELSKGGRSLLQGRTARN